MTQGSGEVRSEAARLPIASDAVAASAQSQALQPQASSAQDVDLPLAAVMVDPAEGPGPAVRDARDALAATRSRLGRLLETVEGHVRCGTLPLVGWGLSVPKVPTLSLEESGHVWSVIGDIHGDFVALHRLLARVRADAGFRLLFLGDLIDRGPHSLECVAALLETALECPNQVLWIAGNHDEALRREAASGQFRSSVEPAEFVDELQVVKAWASPEQLQRWGVAFIEIVRRLPRAVCFADGTLATHGGIPLSDHHPHIKSREALHWESCLRDFTWTRAANKPRSLFDAERRRSGSSDFQFGFKDLDQFCAALGSVLGSPVKRLVRGHDHVEAGVDRPSGFVNTPVLTLNGFGFHHLDNSLQRYKAKLPLGRLRQGNPIEIEDVPVEQPAYIIVDRQASCSPPVTVAGPQRD
jgi:hypothetical protein